MKKISLIISALLLIGCGGGGSNTSNNTNEIKGKVIDGYVKNAIVCLDLNNNFKCDTNEPFTITDKNGNYSLKTKDNKLHILISKGGIDIENNLPAITMYSNTKYKNITPLTSLAIKEGEKKVAEFFNISISDIAKDPMKDNEIKNIIKNIVDNFKITGKYKLTNNHVLIDTRKPIDTKKNENNISTESSIKETKANENIPPQINGNLTPPQIGD